MSMLYSVQKVKVDELLKELDQFSKKVDDELGLPLDAGNKALLREIVFLWLDRSDYIYKLNS